MLLSRLKVKDGRVERRGEINYGKKVFEKRGWIIEHTPEGTFVIKKPSGNYYGSPSSLEEGKKYIENELKSSSQDSSITEGSKIVVNTENHVNENALAIKVNEDNCLVRFENGDEETIPIESISAFESMANDAEKIPEGYINYYGAVVKNTPEDILRQVQKTLYPNENKDKCMKDAPAPKDFFDLDEWKAKAKELGYTIENNKTRGLWIAKEGIGEMGTYNPTKGGRLIVSRPYLDQSSYETETKINELKQNMDAARARGYDTAPYQKEIDRLKSLDANNDYIEISPETGGYDISVYQDGKKVKSTWKSDQSSARQAASIFADYYRDDNGQSLTIKFKGQDKYTGDPLTDKGKEIMAALKEQYGEEKGEQVFYAMKNSGQIEGIDNKTKDTDYQTITVKGYEVSKNVKVAIEDTRFGKVYVIADIPGIYDNSLYKTKGFRSMEDLKTYARKIIIDFLEEDD